MQITALHWRINALIQLRYIATVSRFFSKQNTYENELNRLTYMSLFKIVFKTLILDFKKGIVLSLFCFTVEENKRMRIADENNLNYGYTKVIKKGKANGDTEGLLISGSGSIAVKRDLTTGYTYMFNNLYIIKSTTENTPFFKEGDSGSAVFVQDAMKDRLKPLGIAFAYSADGETYACRIDKIVQAFNLSIYEEEDNKDNSL